MDYTITYTLGEWWNTDTIVLHVNMTGVPAEKRDWYSNPELIKKVLIEYGVEEADAQNILDEGWYFIRNCLDTDCRIKLSEEL